MKHKKRVALTNDDWQLIIRAIDDKIDSPGYIKMLEGYKCLKANVEWQLEKQKLKSDREEQRKINAFNKKWDIP